MDLELTHEQTWLSESLTTLLEREWPAAEAAHEAAIARMAYLFAAVQDTDAFVAQVRALQPAAG